MDSRQYRDINISRDGRAKLPGDDADDSLVGGSQTTHWSRVASSLEGHDMGDDSRVNGNRVVRHMVVSVEHTYPRVLNDGDLRAVVQHRTEDLVAD